MRMRAPVLTAVGEPLVVEEVELEAPREGEVLVRMAASGVCHSCLHAADGSWQGTPVPMVLGDEGAGVVEQVGPGVARLRPGDHVILSWAPTCGRCHYCVTGRPVICEDRPPHHRMRDGTTRLRLGDTDVYHYGSVATFGPYSVVPESCAVKIRADMPLDKAALIGCSVMTGVGAVINTARVPPGASLVVVGCGGIGLNAVQGGRLVNAEPLIAVDVADTKLDYARRLGATHTVNAAREDMPEAVRRLTGRGADFAVIAVGDARAVRQGWDSLARGGTCVVVGLPPTDQVIQIEPFSLVGPERRLVGSSYGSASVFDDFPRLVNLYLAGKLKIDELISRRYTIDQTNEAFRALAGGELARGILVFDGAAVT
jgi:S-(hydroxymethyl)glutathione dehydrogenase / alcohol dehydrogenase